MAYLQAVKDKIVVSLIDRENVTKSGLIIPETAQSEPQRYGTVISIGSEVKEINEGDVISFHERAGMDILLDGNKIKCIAYPEVYGIVKK